MAYDTDTGDLYLPTNIGLVYINTNDSNREPKFIAEGVFQLHTNMVYCDLKDGYLFVGYQRQGVVIYRVHDKKNIYWVSTIGEKYFNRSPDEGIFINDFVIREQMVEIVDTSNKYQSIDPWASTFFKANYNLGQRNDYIKKDDKKSAHLYIAEKKGIYILNLDGLY